MAEPDLSGALFLIDGNSLAYRAFYALPETIATSDGLPTNALYGFSTMLVKILTDYRPAGVMVAWDAGKRVFRHEEYEKYKAGRKPMPDSMARQIEFFDELVSAFGIESLKKEGYEADDILATLVRLARAKGRKVVVVTADRDALQLVDEDVYVMTNTKGISEVKIYDREAVIGRYGVPPEKVPDFIGLKGDSSDNIPGVPGIGDKTACALLEKHVSLEELLDHVEELKGKRRQLLEEHGEQALFSKELATMYDEVPIEISDEELELAAPDRTRLRDVLARFEFNTLLKRLEDLGIIEVAAESVKRLEVAEVAPDRLIEEIAAAGSLAIRTGKRGDDVLVAVYAGENKVFVTSGNHGQLDDLLSQIWQNRNGKPRVYCHAAKKLIMPLPSIPVEQGHDTQLAAYLLRPAAKSYKLDQLASSAGIQIEADGADPDALDLAAEAAQVFHITESQLAALERLGLDNLFAEVEMPLVRVLADMERTGVKIDLARLGELAHKIADRLHQLADEIYELAGEEFNIDSPKQLGAILFENLRLPPGRKTKTGYSTDASVLRGLRDAHPIIGKVETYRELAKLSNTYLETLPGLADQESWRIHTTFNQTVTATGRLSSSNPNLQNIPVRTPLGEKIRDCFIAQEGCRLIAADYSQVELRILAHLSGESKLRDAFRAGEDIHRATAAEVFKLEPSEVSSRERGRAKAVNFGIIYGISAFGLSEQLDISQEEAAGYIDSYLARYPKVAEFRQQVIDEAARSGYVSTIMGRRRLIPELRSAEDRVRRQGERLAVNTVIQGSAADIIKVAMINAHRRLKEQNLRSRLVLQVHDELIFESPEDEAEAVSRLVSREMAGACELDPPLVVDIGEGETWLEAK